MASLQKLLIEDPKPLVDRLGAEFFRTLPESAGVYLMRDANDVVLYVGKAKSLRKRLNSYRVANPDRMARRHLRLLRSVARIEVEHHPDEQAALAREAALLLLLRPRFNRAGVWRPPERWLVWRRHRSEVQLNVTGTPGPEWSLLGPKGGRARRVQATLARLLWWSVNAELGMHGIPAGWFDRTWRTECAVDAGPHCNSVGSSLAALEKGESRPLKDWVSGRLEGKLGTFEQAVLAADMELLEDSFEPLQACESDPSVLPLCDMATKTAVILGASKDREKFGNKAVRAYRDRGFEVFPVNPKESEIEGLKVYANISEVPVRPSVISVYLPPPILLKLLPEIAARGCDELWLNPGTGSDEVVAMAEKLGLNVVQACSLIANGWTGG